MEILEGTSEHLQELLSHGGAEENGQLLLFLSSVENSSEE